MEALCVAVRQQFNPFHSGYRYSEDADEMLYMVAFRSALFAKING